MEFDLATEQGFYGPEDDPDSEYFQVEAGKEDMVITFESCRDQGDIFYAYRPANFNSGDFLDRAYDDPDVYPNSDTRVIPDFPIAEGSYEEVPLTFYSARSEESRESDAAVEVSLEESRGKERVRWVNVKADPEFEYGDYDNEIWYIGEEIEKEPIVHYLSQDPTDMEEMASLVDEVQELFNQHEFEKF